MKACLFFQAVFIHNLMKLYAHIRHKVSTEEDRERAYKVIFSNILNCIFQRFKRVFLFPLQLLNILKERLSPFMQSADLEVQERASCAVHILKVMAKLKEAGEEEAGVNELMELFQGELNPVAPKAQRKVPVPEG